MRFNNLMLSKLRTVSLRSNLDEQLRKIVDNGFIKKQGFYFLRSVAKISKPIVEDLHFDAIGLEHCLNSFHLDSISKHLGLNRIHREDALAQSLIFISELFKKWRDKFAPLVLVATLSESDDVADSVVDYSIKLSFYVKRNPNDAWLASDLEAYTEEAILETDSQTDVLSEIENIQSCHCLGQHT